MRPILFLFLFSAVSLYSHAQERDTNYIDPYNRMITARAFISQKYTIFGIEGSQGFRTIQYRPNTKLTLGLGATYRALTVNLGIGLPNKDDFKGNTRYLDLQTHLYGARWKYDLFGQIYRGYYIYPLGYGTNDKNTYYQRPDLHVRELGMNAYHIYNNKRFSYRASFLQSEWQKKSAGSFLLGGGIVFGDIFADSAFVPSLLAGNYPQSAVKKLRYFEMGPGAGYAYTFVWKENWFATGSLTVSTDFGIVRETIGNSRKTSVHISPNFLFRMGLGYNSSDWSLNFSWITSRTAVQGQYRNGGYNVNTGNYRFTAARRFTPGEQLRKFLKLADRMLDR